MRRPFKRNKWLHGRRLRHADFVILTATDVAHGAAREALLNKVIEKRIELAAPPSRVRRALTDHGECGAGFRVKLEWPIRGRSVTRGTVACA